MCGMYLQTPDCPSTLSGCPILGYIILANLSTSWNLIFVLGIFSHLVCIGTHNYRTDATEELLGVAAALGLTSRTFPALTTS